MGTSKSREDVLRQLLRPGVAVLVNCLACQDVIKKTKQKNSQYALPPPPHQPIRYTGLKAKVLRFFVVVFFFPYKTDGPVDPFSFVTEPFLYVCNYFRSVCVFEESLKSSYLPLISVFNLFKTQRCCMFVKAEVSSNSTQ